MVKKSTNKEETAAKTFDCKVTRVHQFDEKHISFDMIANGVSISGMNYIEYTNKEGKDGVMLSFPQRKGKDDKYYNIVWMPLTAELRDDIIKQIESLL